MYEAKDKRTQAVSPRNTVVKAKYRLFVFKKSPYVAKKKRKKCQMPNARKNKEEKNADHTSSFHFFFKPNMKTAGTFSLVHQAFSTNQSFQFFLPIRKLRAPFPSLSTSYCCIYVTLHGEIFAWCVESCAVPIAILSRLVQEFYIRGYR